MRYHVEFYEGKSVIVENVEGVEYFNNYVYFHRGILGISTYHISKIKSFFLMQA